MATRLTSSAAATSPVPVVGFERLLSSDQEWAMSEGSLFFDEKGRVQETLRRITRKLDELGVPYAVAGGMALFRHGYRRFTEDVDILVTREDLKRIHQELDGRGFTPPFERSKNLRDAQTGVRIEFLIAGDFPGDGKPKEVAFPDPAAVSETKGEIKVLNLPTLITLKLTSGLTGADRRKDLIDVEELIKSLGLTADFASQLHPSVQPAFIEICNRLASISKRYMKVWRNKWLTANATSIEDMITSLRAAADELERMKADGITLDRKAGVADDYAYLITSDPIVARKYDMAPEEEFMEDECSPESTKAP